MLVAALAVIVMVLVSIIVAIVLDPPINLIILGMFCLCLLGIYLSDKFNKRRKP